MCTCKKTPVSFEFELATFMLSRSKSMNSDLFGSWQPFLKCQSFPQTTECTNKTVGALKMVATDNIFIEITLSRKFMRGTIDTGLKPDECNGFPEHSKPAVALSIWIPLGPCQQIKHVCTNENCLHERIIHTYKMHVKSAENCWLEKRGLDWHSAVSWSLVSLYNKYNTVCKMYTSLILFLPGYTIH